MNTPPVPDPASHLQDHAGPAAQDAGSIDVPMFPLGSVLFPHALLPLQVFEPRYLTMMEHVLAGDGRFGVVLIERGSEVGGGDVRFGVGTLATVVGAQPAADGRLLVVGAGIRRLRVEQWLPDAPYPRARVRLPVDEPPLQPTEAALAEVAELLRSLFALWAELDDRVQPPTVNLSSDPVVASYEAAALAPIGALDAQRILEIDAADLRLARLAGHLRDETEILRLRLRG